MVRTRSQTISIERQNPNPNNALAEIREKSKSMAEGRYIDRNLNRPKSPRKRLSSIKKQKAKRDSMKFELMLKNTKENLSKVKNYLLSSILGIHHSFFYINRLPIAFWRIFGSSKKVCLIKSTSQSLTAKRRKNSSRLQLLSKTSQILRFLCKITEESTFYIQKFRS